MPTPAPGLRRRSGLDAAAASARDPMDWEAMHREQQRQITASMAEDFKHRDKVRRQRLEDALAAMQPKPSTRPAEEVAELRARLERLQQTVGLDDNSPPTPYRCGRSIMPTPDDA